MTTPPKLVLASGSPRRRELLSDAGYDFEVVVPEVEEIEDPARSIRDLTEWNARLKGEAVAGDRSGAVIVAADTLVLLGEKVFGKPKTRDEAAAMLAELNGRTHQVFTAVYVAQPDQQRSHPFSVTTEVEFRDLSPDERAAYHQLVDPMDKAGAYAAQEHGEVIIRHVRGSMTNVVGLPMGELQEVLAAFGVFPQGGK